MAGKHLDVFGSMKAGRASGVVLRFDRPLFRLRYPGLIVPVTVEYDALVLLDGPLDKLAQVV